MAITFSLRGGSLNARYAPNGATAGVLGSSATNVAKTASDGTSIGGTVIDLTGQVQRGLAFPGRSNWSGNNGFSILLRLKTDYTGTPTATVSLFGIGIAATNYPGAVYVSHNVTTGKLNITLRNDYGTNIISTTTTEVWSFTSGTWYDLAMSYDGTLSTNAFKIYKDSVLTSQVSGAATYTASSAPNRDNTKVTSITVGLNFTANNPSFYVGEFVIWDSVIDFTQNQTLVSGSGLINGASRTSFVDVISFDGTTNTDPGIANVRSGTGYTIAGSSLTGTCAVPTASNVLNGVSTDATTGNVTLPTAANVKTGTTFGSSLGSTGTYDGSDRWTDPGVTNVRNATAYKANSTSNNKTGSLDLPSTSNVKTGVTFDGASQTGTYDGSDRWTDVGVANVRSGSTYKANSATTNRTGTCVVPTAANVRSGTSVDATTGTLAVPTAANVRSGTAVDATTGTCSVPTAANVRSGTAVDATTGTLAVPAASNVRSGISVDAGTGTCVVPTAANVRSGTSVDATTGTLAVPSAGNVRSGIAVDAGTGTLVAPSLANTKIGVAGDGGTGTYDGSDRWTDPGQSNVLSGVQYQANSTTNNKTGSLPSGVRIEISNSTLSGQHTSGVLVEG